jgi:uncharacterized protein DUF4038/uncharacterized protein DUF5060
MKLLGCPPTAARGVPFEIRLQADSGAANPVADIEVDVTVHSADGHPLRVPAFWRGGDIWCARVAPAATGLHEFRVSARGPRDAGGLAGAFTVEPYEGSNPLYVHGGVTVSADRRHLAHHDGTPFFWLADTWWYGATRRCAWPAEFRVLAADRRRKGFSVVQMVVGIPPEIEPDDPSSGNEGGLPFAGAWDRLNPLYFEYVDRRIRHLVDSGLMPCIVGAWGHHLAWLGEEQMMRYWRYLVARYAAFPVAWCLSGESDLRPGERPRPPVRPAGSPGRARRPLRHLIGRLPRRSRALVVAGGLTARARLYRHLGALRARRDGWEHVGEIVAATDPYRRLRTIHPIPGVYGHEAVNGAGWLDLTAVQSGHARGMAGWMVERVLRATRAAGGGPIVNLEPWYEGILGDFWEQDQRYAFWMCILAGAAGHSYGSHGVWQMGREDEPFLAHWGAADWRRAVRYSGSGQLGVAKRWLERLAWWRLEPKPELIRPRWEKRRPAYPLLAAIAGEVWLAYFPATGAGFDWEISGLDGGARYRWGWLDPRTGDEREIGVSRASGEGAWSAGFRPSLDDWVLVGRREASGS